VHVGHPRRIFVIKDVRSIGAAIEKTVGFFERLMKSSAPSSVNMENTVCSLENNGAGELRSYQSIVRRAAA
jgi:hypothetical protein